MPSWTSEEREEKKIKMAHLEETNQKIQIQIVKTTGGSFEVTVDNDITVENLKKIVSKKLKISKDRICLMNSERWEREIKN